MCNEKSEKTRDGSPASGGGVLQKLYRKGNTMTEKKQKQKDAEAKIKAALGDALAAEMGDIPKASITIEELKALELEDRKNKRKRIVRFIGVAAVIMLIFGAAVYAVWPQTAVPVDADKNTEQKVEESDGVVVINEGDGNGEAGITEYNETDWDKIGKYKIYFTELVIPEFMIKNYSFKSLVIEEYCEDGFWAQYTFKNEFADLYIEQRKYNEKGINTGQLEKVTDSIDTKNGKIYFVEKKNEPLLSVIYTDRSIVKVTGFISKEQSIKIINALF